ncbi:hypothetical protein [Microbacterium sp. LWH13-1.2]|uniref:hypothetical protein n=1 Tax=Microbacterium sp. LWH13-1.2 TaxID=3135260 RepID=UPI0031396119
MRLPDLHKLEPADQQALLLGRIGMEAVRMEVALRFLHSVLAGHRDFESYLDAPPFFSDTAKECMAMIRENTSLIGEERRAIHRAVKIARGLYSRRNRFVHDFLRVSLADRSQWELAPVARLADSVPDAVPTNPEAMVDFIRDLVAGAYRLRAAAMYLMVDDESLWEDGLFGHLNGQWDGSVESVMAS